MAVAAVTSATCFASICAASSSGCGKAAFFSGGFGPTGLPQFQGGRAPASLRKVCFSSPTGTVLSARRRAAVSKAAEYRRKAAQCRAEVEKATSPEMAATWRKLALRWEALARQVVAWDGRNSPVQPGTKKPR
jgi:hypothetical protein